MAKIFLPEKNATAKLGKLFRLIKRKKDQKGSTPELIRLTMNNIY